MRTRCARPRSRSLRAPPPAAPPRARLARSCGRRSRGRASRCWPGRRAGSPCRPAARPARWRLFAHLTAASLCSASSKVERLAYASASSRPGSSPASTSTASSPARSDSASRPGHQSISESRTSATAFAAAIAQLAMARECALLCGDRLVHLIGEVALLRASLEQTGELARRHAPRRSARRARTARPPRGALPAPRPGRPQRSRSAASHRHRPRPRRGAPAEPGRARAREAADSASSTRRCSSDAPMRADRILDGEPRELVAERDRAPLGAQHAGREAGIDVLDLIRHDLVEQPHLDMRRDDGDRLEHALRGRAEAVHAREHGIAHRRRHLRCSRRPAPPSRRTDCRRSGRRARRHRRRASPASSSTAARESGGRRSRTTPGAVPSSPTARRSGCMASSSSSR